MTTSQKQWENSEAILQSREPLSDTSKGGFRTLPFIILSAAFEKAASYGIMPNLITYMMEGYGFGLVAGSQLLFLWTSAIELTPIIGAFLADSYVGRFRMIGLGSLMSLLGMLLFWSTTIIPGARPCSESGSECTPCNKFQLTLLLSSFGLIAIGGGGIRACPFSFGADQIIKRDGLVNATLVEKFFSWFYIASSIAIMFGMTILVYIQDHYGWQVGFGVPVILLVLSCFSFFSASHLYIKVKANGGTVIPLGHVLIASWKKRHLNTSSEVTKNLTYHCKREIRLTAPSNKFRFLNKACIVENPTEELAPDGTALDPWSLCTVDQVEELKALIKVIPMWSTGIISAVSISQTSFLRIQAGSMDRQVTSNFKIPAGVFSSLQIIFFIICITLYDRAIVPLATRVMGKPTRLRVKTKMAIGLLAGFLSMVLEANVESARRKIAIDEGFADNPKAVVDMSALWLLPYYCASGIAVAFYGIGQIEFFYIELPKSMSSIATNLTLLNLSLGNLVSSLIMSIINRLTSNSGKESWVSGNINKAHFDYFFWFLAGLCFLNFLYYLICSKSYGSSQVYISGDKQDIVGE